MITAEQLARVLFQAGTEWKCVHYGNSHRTWHTAKADEQDYFLTMAQAGLEAVEQQEVFGLCSTCGKAASVWSTGATRMCMGCFTLKWYHERSEKEKASEGEHC